jgi:hypothetical protein
MLQGKSVASNFIRPRLERFMDWLTPATLCVRQRRLEALPVVVNSVMATDIMDRN